MYKNKAKKRNTLKTRAQNAAMLAFLCACFGLMIGVPAYNMHVKTDQNSWYVSGGNVQIAAPVQNGANLTATEQQTTTWSGLARPAQTEEPAVVVTSNAFSVMPAVVPTEVPAAMEVPMPTEVPAPEVTRITITAVGDCTLGGNVPSGGDDRFDSYVQKYGYDYFFENVRDIFENDDLTIVNLEGPLTTSNSMRANRTFNFRGKTEYVNILSGSSVEVCNVANNHSQDFGKSGLSQTAEVLSEAGIGVTGYEKVYTTTVNGVRVSFLGFTQWDYTAREIQKACEKARADCDLLIVSVHWGEEKNYRATDLQKSLGRAAIDGGADLVLGHHSHVIGGVDQYKGKYIIYSLGNFCFGGNGNPSDQRTLIFQQTFEFDASGQWTNGGINIIPAAVSSTGSKNNFQPMMLTGEAGEDLLKNIARYSTLSMADTLWMPDSYMATLGYGQASGDQDASDALAA